MGWVKSLHYVVCSTPVPCIVSSGGHGTAPRGGAQRGQLSDQRRLLGAICARIQGGLKVSDPQIYGLLQCEENSLYLLQDCLSWRLICFLPKEEFLNSCFWRRWCWWKSSACRINCSRVEETCLRYLLVVFRTTPPGLWECASHKGASVLPQRWAGIKKALFAFFMHLYLRNACPIYITLLNHLKNRLKIAEAEP